MPEDKAKLQKLAKRVYELTADKDWGHARVSRRNKEQITHIPVKKLPFMDWDKYYWDEYRIRTSPNVKLAGHYVRLHVVGVNTAQDYSRKNYHWVVVTVDDRVIYPGGWYKAPNQLTYTKVTKTPWYKANKRETTDSQHKWSTLMVQHGWRAANAAHRSKRDDMLKELSKKLGLDEQAELISAANEAICRICEERLDKLNAEIDFPSLENIPSDL